jgi:hypothetical protein
VRPPLTEPLHQLAEAWRSATGTSRRRVAVALVALVWVLALLVARHGTMRARVGAAIAIGMSAAIAVGWRVIERRRLREPERIVRGLARAVDRDRAERALRALSLVGPDGDVRAEGTSAELARLHVSRALAQLPSERIVERAAKRAGRLGAAALVVGVCVLGLGLANSWSVLEGGDVLAARGGTAPVTMRWLDEVEVIARPPEYLHDSEHHEVALVPLMLPYGTLVTVRGVPIHPGRRLLLSDGVTEVPFVDDGAGAELARWPLTQTATLHVVARFGEVVVREPDALALQSIPDASPVVTLEGAPRQTLLVEQSDDIPIRYEATDDHGLREVHLVLRSGTREERRVLARLDGETRSDKGGQVLKLRDSFLKKSHAPVEVTVEAKDNDPLTGPKWGSSPAITLIPPDVGEPEARRLDALRKLRDALVDTLAWRLASDPPAAGPARKVFLADERARADADDRLLEATLGETYAGVKIATRLRALLVGQQQKTRAAVLAELRAPSGTTHAAAVKATERFVLVVDAVVRGLGVHDSRDAARQLADVADDLALGASQMQNEADRDARSRGTVRMDAATVVLAGGGRVMKRLGVLGRDLGEIVEADLLRVKRGRDGGDLIHAELAARDLATRLREPDPSFGARGRMGRAGGESGGGQGTPGEEGGDSGDEVDQAQQEAEQDLERLAQEHAGQIGKMEQALAGATSDEELKQLREEARRHAEAIREAARELPTVGMGSDSWTSKGAAARELAEQMARSLEQTRPDEAVQSGRSALGSLDEAKKMLQKGAWLEDPSGDEQKRVDDARRKLDAEERWAEEQLAQMRKRAAERARKQLEEGGDEESKLADRARELGERSRDKGSLPQQAVESIEDAERAARQAAQALKQGDADKGLEHQREAQRDLEAARQQLQGDDDESGQSSPKEGDGQKASNAPVAIPNASEHKGPEEFRRRVVRGLGQPASGALKDAVHRYAEGLLR